MESGSEDHHNSKFGTFLEFWLNILGEMIHLGLSSVIHPILIAQERVAFTCSKTKLVVSRAFGEQIKEDWTLALLLCSQ